MKSQALDDFLVLSFQTIFYSFEIVFARNFHDLQWIDIFQITGNTPLMMAVKDNKTPLIDRLVELGSDVCARNNVSIVFINHFRHFSLSGFPLTRNSTHYMTQIITNE